jgi:hypothetical protein
MRASLFCVSFFFHFMVYPPTVNSQPPTEFGRLCRLLGRAKMFKLATSPFFH